MTDSPQKRAYQYCLRLLARREYSQVELRQKLRQQAFEIQTIDECLAQLIKDNYQSDQRFAEMFCLHYELKQKGIDDSLSSSVLAEYEQVWVENAKYLIEHKAPRKDSICSDYAIKSKIIRFLLGKGYDYDTINLAFDRLQSNE